MKTLRLFDEFESFSLSEKMAMVESDVDMLYDKYFRKEYEEIQRTGRIRPDMFQEQTTNTSILKDKESVEANKLNMCLIIVNDEKYDNAYQPENSFIFISAPKSAAKFVLEEGGDLETAIKELKLYGQDSQARTLPMEFTEERIKGSIHHELAHWIDDTMNNRHIYKTLQGFVKAGKRPRDFVGSKIEIHAQIHNIKQLYNKFKDKWDDITFDDLIDMSASLTVVDYKLLGKKNYRNKQWRRDLKTRMNREGLLGKKMR